MNEVYTKVSPVIQCEPSERNAEEWHEMPQCSLFEKGRIIAELEEERSVA